MSKTDDVDLGWRSGTLTVGDGEPTPLDVRDAEGAEHKTRRLFETRRLLDPFPPGAEVRWREGKRRFRLEEAYRERRLYWARPLER